MVIGFHALAQSQDRESSMKFFPCLLPMRCIYELKIYDRMRKQKLLERFELLINRLINFISAFIPGNSLYEYLKQDQHLEIYSKSRIFIVEHDKI
jgi:hypothetical protein